MTELKIGQTWGHSKHRDPWGISTTYQATITDIRDGWVMYDRTLRVLGLEPIQPQRNDCVAQFEQFRETYPYLLPVKTLRLTTATRPGW